MLTVGEVLDDRFVITRKLGEGSFGVVWKAKDKVTKKKVAVKVVINTLNGSRCKMRRALSRKKR